MTKKALVLPIVIGVFLGVIAREITLHFNPRYRERDIDYYCNWMKYCQLKEAFQEQFDKRSTFKMETEK